MKQFYLFLILFASVRVISYSQSPPGIPYQAIARSTTGEPYASGALQTRFSLHEQTATGTVSYAEMHSLQTDEFGLFSTTFGAGTPINGTFAAINWGLTTKYLQVEIDLGNGWIDMGTQQLMSVPYAMYAGSAGGLNNNISENWSAVSNRSMGSYTFIEAINYCSNLNEGGYSDWRMPSLEEVIDWISVSGIPSNDMSSWTKTPTNTIRNSGKLEPEFYIVQLNGASSQISSMVALAQNYNYGGVIYEVHFPVVCFR
jgi:hypothetical protein